MPSAYVCGEQMSDSSVLPSCKPGSEDAMSVKSLGTWAVCSDGVLVRFFDGVLVVGAPRSLTADVDMPS